MAKAKRKSSRRPAASRKTGQRKMTVTMSQLALANADMGILKDLGVLGAARRPAATKKCKLIRTKTGVRKGCYNSAGQFRFVKSK